MTEKPLNTGGKDASIILICVYMGELPFWMPAFFLSCSYCPEIHWLIISDCPKPSSIPSNVSYFRLCLDDLNYRFSKALGVNVRITSDYAYKINDLKIAFGDVFSEEIQEYDFWGYCDLDIVWGSIKSFINKELLDDYDIVTSRVRRVSGHFCLFRNSYEISMMYNYIPNFRKMIVDRKNYAIDEENITNYLFSLLYPNWIVRLKQLFIKKGLVVPRVYWDSVMTTSGAHQRALGEGTTRSFLWKNGKVYDADHSSELMYIHFHKIKQSMKKINFTYEEQPREFLINREGLFA